MNRSRLLQILQIIIVVAIFAYVIHDINIEETYRAFLKVDFTDLVYIGIFELLYSLSNGIAFWILCRKEFNLSLAEGIGASMFAWLVDILIPLAFIEGDLARMLFLKTKKDWSSALGYTLVFRFLVNSTFAVFIVITTLASLNFIYLYKQYMLFYIIVIVLLFLTILLLAFIIFDTERVKRLIVYVLRRFASKHPLIDKIEEDIVGFLDSMKKSLERVGQKSPTLWLATLMLFVQWISGIMTPYFSLRAVDVVINPIFIAPGYSILTVFSLASIGLPFMVGSVDAALITLYLLLGVPKEKALVATIIGRSITIVTSLAIIYPVGIYYARKVISARNLDEIKHSLQKLIVEYKINIPLADIILKNE